MNRGIDHVNYFFDHEKVVGGVVHTQDSQRDGAHRIVVFALTKLLEFSI